MNARKLVLLDHRSSHHAGPSGYGRLADFVDCEVVPERELPFPPWRVQRALARRCGPNYTTTSFSKELALLGRMLANRGGVAHFLNAELDYHYSSHWSRLLGWRTIGTFHKPPSQFTGIFTDPSVIRHLDGAICVGSNQVAAVKELLGHDRVWLAPLGVDTEFFDLPKEPRASDEAICLFVGSHLRDFATLRNVADALAQRGGTARIVAIGPARYAYEIPQHPRITVYGDISDEELRAWYHRASLLLMPLRDSTANSSILEAIACGTPVVASDVGGVRDYLTNECAFLTPAGDATAMTGAALSLLSDPALRARMSAAARKQALRFSWPVVAKTISGIYSSL